MRMEKNAAKEVNSVRCQIRIGGYQVGNGEQAGVEEHEHLQQDLPAEVCHTGTASKMNVMCAKSLINDIWRSGRESQRCGSLKILAWACGIGKQVSAELVSGCWSPRASDTASREWETCAGPAPRQGVVLCALSSCSFARRTDLAPGLIRFDNQHDSIRQLSDKRRLRLTAKRGRADEDVIKCLAQFGEALSITLHRRVKARLHQTRGDQPQILPAERRCKIPNGTGDR